MNVFTKTGFPVPALILFVLFVSLGSCGIYKFADVSVDPEVKTVRVQFIENRAPYINPQLSPTLTDKLRQKINNQTRLTQTNSDSAHYDISGEVQEYSVSTSAISNKQEVMNRLTVRVKITLNDQLKDKKLDFDISRNFEFPANSSLQAAESRLLDEMVRNLTDDIFNRIFSNW